MGVLSVMEIASYDALTLPDGTSIQAGAPSYRLASLWPLRYRAEKDGLAPFSLQVSPNSKWYEGAGNLWIFVAQDGRSEYFDLSQNGAYR